MKSVFILFFLSISLLISAQAPTQISYQGVARNSSGTVIVNQQIAIKFDIHQGSAAGTVVFTEQHTGIDGVSTNAFGIFTTYIGSINNLGVVNWANGPFFIEVSIDPANGTAYNSLGSQQLMSVPFALYAQTAGNASSSPTITINSPNTINNTTTGVYDIFVPTNSTYTLTSNSNTITLNNGSSVSSVTVPAVSFYTISANSNTIILDNGSSISTATVPVSSLYTLSSTSNSISLDNGSSVSTVTVPVYSAGNGIDISTSGVISNTSTAVTPTITAGNNITINPTTPSNSYTISAPTYSLAQTGNNIELLQNGTSIGTATLPVVTSYSAGNGISISGNFISNTLTPVTPTINSGGVVNVTNPSSNVYLVDVPAPSLNYNSSTNELTLTQNGATSTATLNGTGANTVSIVGSGLASVTPTTGSTFTVNVPNIIQGNDNITIGTFGGNITLSPRDYTLTSNSNTLTLTNGGTSSYTSIVTVPLTNITPSTGITVLGTAPNYTISSASSPTTTLVEGNNISLNHSGNTYTVNAPAYSLSSNSNTLTLTNGTVVSSATVPASPSYSGTPNNISVISNSINLVPTGVTSGIYGANATNAVPTYSVDNFGRLISSGQYTTTLSGDVLGAANTTTVTKLQTRPVSNAAPTANQVLTWNGSAWTPSSTVVPILSYTGSAIAGTLQSGAQTVTIPNYTLSNGVNTNTITLNNGTASSSVVIAPPTLTLSGNTLQSGPATNTVSLSGLGGIYGGSGFIPTGSTTVSIGTNTLSFMASNNSKPILNVVGSGTLQPSVINVGNATTGASGIRFSGSFTTAPINYGQLLGSSSGLTMGAGSFTTALSTSTNGNVLVNTTSDVQGRFQVSQISSTVNPHVNIISPTGANYGRFKYSNSGNASYFSNEAVSMDGDMGNSAWSVSHYNGAGKEWPVLLINGQRKVYINAFNIPVAAFHVMTNTATAQGIASEGFNQPGQLILARNNEPGGISARVAINNGEEIGRILFAGYNGTSYTGGYGTPNIKVRASEAFTNAKMGTDMVFSTVRNGGIVEYEVMKLLNTGKVIIQDSLQLPFSGYGFGKFLTSDNFGNTFWSSPPAGAWISSLGSTTLTNISDKVGIGTSNPLSALHVETDGTLTNGLRVGNLNSTSNGPSIYLDGQNQDWTITGANAGNGSGANKFVIRDYTNAADRFVIDNTGNVGIGLVSPEGMLHVRNSTGAQIKFGNNNQPSYDWYFDVDGAANMYLKNESLGSSVMSFNPNNGFVGIGTNTPLAFLDVVGSGDVAAIGATSSGTVDAITAKNTNALTTSYAGNFDGGLTVKGKTTANADYALKVSSSSFEVFGIRNNGNIGINVLNPMYKLQINSSNTVAALYSENIVTGNFPNAHGVWGRVSASNTSTAAAAVYANSNGSGPSIYGVKNGSDANGSAGRFEILSTSNSADGVFVSNNGVGAAIHAVSGPTVAGSSNVALLLEGGHVKTLGGTPSVVTLIAGTASIVGNDIVGTYVITSSSSTTADQNVVNVTFNKPYSTAPNVMLFGNNGAAFNAKPYATSVTSTGFTITFNGSVAPGTYSIKYLVIQ